MFIFAIITFMSLLSFTNQATVCDEIRAEMCLGIEPPTCHKELKMFF